MPRKFLVLAALAAAVAGCSSGSVAVSVPAVTPGAVGVCHALHAALPDRLGGAGRRQTDPSSDTTAAWGDPAIVLTCGVGLPGQLNPASPSYDPQADVVGVNGVDWLNQPVADGYRFTTHGRGVFIQVDVPHHYAPEVDVLVNLAGPVGATDPIDPNAP